ncbi:MAG: NHLP bacteriocin system secretion protein, partial [Crocosphaera sp.]
MLLKTRLFSKKSKQDASVPRKSTPTISQKVVSPDKFDDLVQVVDSHNWLSLCTYGSIVALILLWGVFGKIPVNVTGKGVLIYPNTINDLESPIKGKIEQVKVKTGECVTKDQVLAIIDPSDIKQQLKQEKIKLVQLQSQDNQADFLQQQQTNLQTQTVTQHKASKQQQLETALALTPLLKKQGFESISKQKKSVEKKLTHLQQINPQLKQNSLDSLKKQRISLEQQSKDVAEILPVLKDRWTKRQSLKNQGALSADQVLESEQEYRQALQKQSDLQAKVQELQVQETQIQQQYLDNLGKISDYQAQLTELQLKETEAREKYEQNLSKISQLKADIKELDSQQKRVAQDNLKEENQRNNQIQETQRNIARLQKQYDDNREIKSPVNGCILELTASKGDIIETGERLGGMSLKNNSSQMIGVAYFPIGEGKKVQVGMKVQITPDTVKRERFGG